MPPLIQPTSSPASDPSSWFAAEVQPHDAALRAYLRGNFPSVRDIDDVVQESYLRVWRANPANTVRSARAFLFTVARRLALDFLRHKRRSPFVEVADLNALFVAADESPAGDAAARADEVQLLVDAVAALPPRCREVFVLRKIHGVAPREIAARLGLSEQTVQNQTARGLRKCGDYIRERIDLP